MATTFTDEMLGLITVRVNVRARRIIMRPQSDGVMVTVPSGTTQRNLVDTLNNYRQQLRAHQLELKKKKAEEGSGKSFINLDFSIHTDLMDLTLEEGPHVDFRLRAKPGHVVIVCPPDTPFTDSQQQEWLHRVVERALRQQAQWLLPERIRALSVLHGMPFGICRVNVSKGRWGSCSIRKDINLSCYLMLLPPHLREYVMLHELCHTREMNHSPKFWALLDSLTSGQSKALRNELKSYNTCL